MIENKIVELFDAINESSEYQAYLNIGKVLENDEEINSLVNEIKTLQQESVRLEEAGNLEYKKVDEIISEKVSLLNSKPIYQEYLRNMSDDFFIASAATSREEIGNPIYPPVRKILDKTTENTQYAEIIGAATVGLSPIAYM